MSGVKEKLHNNSVVTLSLMHIWYGWLSSRHELFVTQEHKSKQHRGPKPDLFFALGHLIWLSLSLSLPPFFTKSFKQFWETEKKKKKNKGKNINVVIHFV